MRLIPVRRVLAGYARASSERRGGVRAALASQRFLDAAGEFAVAADIEVPVCEGRARAPLIVCVDLPSLGETALRAARECGRQGDEPREYAIVHTGAVRLFRTTAKAHVARNLEELGGRTAFAALEDDALAPDALEDALVLECAGVFAAPPRHWGRGRGGGGWWKYD